MKVQYTCQWLTLGSTGLCKRAYLEEYCKVHFTRLRNGLGKNPVKSVGSAPEISTFSVRVVDTVV